MQEDAYHTLEVPQAGLRITHEKSHKLDCASRPRSPTCWILRDCRSQGPCKPLKNDNRLQLVGCIFSINDEFPNSHILDDPQAGSQHRACQRLSLVAAPAGFPSNGPESNPQFASLNAQLNSQISTLKNNAVQVAHAITCHKANASHTHLSLFSNNNKKLQLNATTQAESMQSSAGRAWHC